MRPLSPGVPWTISDDVRSTTLPSSDEFSWFLSSEATRSLGQSTKTGGRSRTQLIMDESEGMSDKQPASRSSLVMLRDGTFAVEVLLQ